MSVNGVSGHSQIDAYSAYTSVKKAANEKPEEKDTVKETLGAVYEPSNEAKEYLKSGKTYKPNTALVQQLKADQAAREQSLMNMVKETLLGQASASSSINSTDDMWKFLASGNYTVTAQAKEEAQKAISEDGVYGVENTANRILDMAKALTGGDPSKIDTMRKAFQKGFSEATKTWGKDLPDISNKTYDSVMKKFDEWENENQ